MNERIRELAEQAKRNEPFDCGALTKDQWLEKFAWLIVEECSRIADGWVDNDDNGKNYPSEMIKQHFEQTWNVE